MRTGMATLYVVDKDGGIRPEDNGRGMAVGEVAVYRHDRQPGWVVAQMVPFGAALGLVVLAIILDGEDGAELERVLAPRTTRAQLQATVKLVKSLLKPADERSQVDLIKAEFNRVRAFLGVPVRKPWPPEALRELIRLGVYSDWFNRPDPRYTSRRRSRRRHPTEQSHD